MTDLREAAQMALEALEYAEQNHGGDDCYFDAIEALRAALAQQEQEPVAWMHTTATGNVYFRKKPQDKVFNPQPVYTAPPQREWQNLNAADMRELGISAIRLDMAKAISAKLKEKNA